VTTHKALLAAATGAALIASAALAGCGSGTKTEPSTSSAAASSASSAAASEPSTAAESADTAHYADVTLPELPGWSDDPDVKWEEGNDFYHVAALKYGETPTSIQVLIARSDKPGEDPITAAQQIAAEVPKGCEPNGAPDPTSMSGFDGFLNAFGCENGVVQFQEALGVHETAAAPASVVLLLGVAGVDQVDKLKEALALITEKGTIVP
jgi:hypothetical protein